jgi:type IV secretory pathway TrbF-like protein
MMAITLVLAFGMVWVSTRSKFVPYVVEVDKLGYAIRAPSALTENITRISTDRMVRNELAAGAIPVTSRAVQAPPVLIPVVRTPLYWPQFAT